MNRLDSKHRLELVVSTDEDGFFQASITASLPFFITVKEKSRTKNRAIAHALSELAVQIDRMKDFPTPS